MTTVKRRIQPLDHGDPGPVPDSVVSLFVAGPVQRFDAEDHAHGLVALVSELDTRSEQGYLELESCSAETDGAPLFVTGGLEVPGTWRPGPPTVPSGPVRVGDAVYGPFEPASKTFQVGRTAVYEVALPSRYEARAIALHHEKRDEHRWLFATRHCAVGRPTWLGADGALAYASVTSAPAAYAPGLLVMDTRKPEVRAIRGAQEAVGGFDLCTDVPPKSGPGCIDYTWTKTGISVTACTERDLPRGSELTQAYDCKLGVRSRLDLRRALRDTRRSERQVATR